MKADEQLQTWFKEQRVYELCLFFFNTRLTPMQEEIVRTVAYNDYKRVCINCMTRYGKSYSLSMGVLLWILMNPDKKIAIVAPTNDKTTIIRNYIATFVTSCNYFYELLDIDKKGSDKIRKEVSKKRMTWKNGVEMRTLSAEGEGQALMGFGVNGMLLIDESCDIDYEVYRSKISRMVGDDPDAKIVEIGNPNHKENHFFQHFINPDWKKIHVGWQDALREGRISQLFLDEQKGELTDREWTILYESKFCEESSDSLLKWVWIQGAIVK